MSRTIFIFFLLGIGLRSAAQSRAGITGTRDSSYTVLSEYNKQKKNFPELDLPSFAAFGFVQEEKDIVYNPTKERALTLDVYYPEQSSSRLRTAIIFLHGGGWRSGDKQMHSALLHQLAARGYVCIAPEYRLSTEALYPAAVFDVKTAIRWVRKHAEEYNIDPDRIVISGHSAGGELAAFAGATNGMKKFERQGSFRKIPADANAVIDIDGILAFIHPESGEGDDSKKTSAATYWFGYSKTENPDLWKEGSALTHANENMPPVLFINSSLERMHAGRDDLIRILAQHHIYYEVKSFDPAPHSFIFFEPWFTPVVEKIDEFLQKVFVEKNQTPRRIVVAQDGSGEFRTVQAAINSLPKKNTRAVTIEIRKGVYREKIFIDSLRRHICLAGEDSSNTILVWDDHTGKLAPNGDTINTRTSWSIKMKADDFTAKNICFQNDAGFSAGQAVAVESDGDRARFFNCRFIGNQDVLFLNEDNSRQYFSSCYIEGTTDFIFGSSTAWFERCNIYSKKNSHVTAASTPAQHAFGFVFNNCRLMGDTALHGVSLGRPWRPYASVTYLRSFIGSHIKPEGWSNWNNTENFRTARYAEYANFGPGANSAGRLSWVRMLSRADEKEYTIWNVLRGWRPEKTDQSN